MDGQSKLWSVLIGTLTGIVPIVAFLYLTRTTALVDVLEVFTGLPVMAALAAGAWWLLIERSQKLQYHRGIVYVACVIILWFVAMGVIDLVMTNWPYIWRADLIDLSGVIFFLLIYALFLATPFILAGGVLLVYIRRYFDERRLIISAR